MRARDELLDEYGRADTAALGTLADLRQKLDAFEAEVLATTSDLATAVIEALAVPYADRTEDDQAAERLIRGRTAFMSGALQSMSQGTGKAKHAAAAIRAGIAAMPVTYTPLRPAELDGGEAE